MRRSCQYRARIAASVVRLVSVVSLLAVSAVTAAPPASSDRAGLYDAHIRPLVRQYCLDCHSSRKHKGDLDLERFGSIAQVRRDVQAWQSVQEMVKTEEMPPANKPQPSPEERQSLLTWVDGFLGDEAVAHAGDPGPVPMRRLSNAEYDCTIRDLTGVDLRPAREFPADGAAGEGFTNAAEALTDISPTLLNKYLMSAKEIAAHAVLLPDGFRFSSGKTRRDWSDESTAKLRAFYAMFTHDGKIPLERYLQATILHRDALLAGREGTDAVATHEKLDPKYFDILWRALNGNEPSYPLDLIREHWRTASDKGSDDIAAQIADWQSKLWNVVKVGSYVNEVRQSAAEPVLNESQTIRLAVKPVPGQSEVVVYLCTREVFSGSAGGHVIWGNPRFEAPGKAALRLRDYASFGPAYEIDYPAVFGDANQYLSAEVESVDDPEMPIDAIAFREGLDAERLRRWTNLLAVDRPAVIPAQSVLGQWRNAASDPALRQRLAQQVRSLLTGLRPSDEKSPDRLLYDNLVTGESPLVKGLDFSRPGKSRSGYGVNLEDFGTQPGRKPIDDSSMDSPSELVQRLRLPARLFDERQFVVDVRLDGAAGDRVVAFDVRTTPPQPYAPWDGRSPLVASSEAARKRLLDGLSAFRETFPMFICFANVIPTDEIVCLKMYHREDEPLIRLFLDEPQHREIDRIWAEHRFITQQPVAENRYLPLFIGFVTQDQPKDVVAYFENKREPFRKLAEAFERDETAAEPKELEKLNDFASRAWRRPLREAERTELHALYQSLRGKGASHEDAFGTLLARVLVAPAFLFRIEQPPAGKEPGPVDDHALATRLSYFLWSSVPDYELRSLANEGRLHDPNVLAAQARRMLTDDRIRSLAIEFGTQWIHVHGFDEFNEKSEKLYPTFDSALRSSIYEESIQFFTDLFQQDEPISCLLDADYTYLNETLAKHYGIPGVSGPRWRKVTGVRKFGRGGILALASVQAKQAGASRTSPVLRGNWVLETLLGEKLPRPPPDVPKLPEEEGTDGLTMRQLVERHVKSDSCSVCHRRIDPIGFAFERYDAIGRLRDKETTGLPVDCHATLKDGTEFDGIAGLRDYLLTKKKDVIVRLFCRRLLGYALGRAVILSDRPLLDEMFAALQRNDGRVSAAVNTIVRSPQFRNIRGSAYTEDE